MKTAPLLIAEQSRKRLEKALIPKARLLIISDNYEHASKLRAALDVDEIEITCVDSHERLNRFVDPPRPAIKELSLITFRQLLHGRLVDFQNQREVP